MKLSRLALLAGAGLFGALSLAQAQQVYRIVGPDGKVTFSDKPPTEAGAKSTTATPGGAGGNNTAALPFELRQVATKYPVTLYTGPNCGPCGSGKALLTGRGIPFSEKTVISNEDVEALQRLAGDATLPMVTIGGQQLKGYSDAEWTQFLDAAGYPKTSALPSSWRPAPAAPLVAVQRAAPASAPQRQAAGETPPPAAAPAPAPPANPAGIKF